jgi:NADH-quinone oxidoreductase subunit C
VVPAAEVLEALKLRYGAAEFALGVEAPRESLLEILRTLRDSHGYRFYVAATATDRSEEIEVVHGVRNLDSGDEFFVKTRLPKTAPEIDSAAHVFAGAEWYEREILDLFGVTFRAHPDPRRILMPDEYEGHPLLKDFPMDTPWGYRPATAAEES